MLKVALGLFSRENTKVFNLTVPVNDNLNYMVEYILGRPKNHHRYPNSFKELRRIYDLSNKPNNCNNPLSQGEEVTCGFGMDIRHSLKAAWFAACTSPELIGVGL